MAAGTGANMCYATYFAEPHTDPLGDGAEKISVLENIYHLRRTAAAPPLAPELLATLVKILKSKKSGVLQFLSQTRALSRVSRLSTDSKSTQTSWDVFRH